MRENWLWAYFNDNLKPYWWAVMLGQWAIGAWAVFNKEYVEPWHVLTWLIIVQPIVAVWLLKKTKIGRSVDSVNLDADTPSDLTEAKPAV